MTNKAASMPPTPANMLSMNPVTGNIDYANSSPLGSSTMQTEIDGHFSFTLFFQAIR